MMFLSPKLDASGNFLWAKKLGQSSGTMGAFSITVDAQRKCLYYRDLYMVVDFDPGPGILQS